MSSKTATNGRLDIELRALEEIYPYERNPRQNDAAVAAVAKSMEQFGVRQPIVVDAAGVIICGHTRWKAAKQLGLAKVPVHVATDLTPEQARAYRIADNKTNELSDWDLEILPIELSELRADGFELEMLGFDNDELAKLLDPGVQQGQCDPDEAPEPPADPITQPGDLWLLGAFTVCPHCGEENQHDAL